MDTKESIHNVKMVYELEWANDDKTVKLIPKNLKDTEPCLKAKNPLNW